MPKDLKCAKQETMKIGKEKVFGGQTAPGKMLHTQNVLVVGC